MNGKAIDPTEIIIEHSKAKREDAFVASPWIRFLSRFLDYAWFILLLWGAKILFQERLTSAKYDSFIPLEFFIWIPFEALLLSTWGSTPGKFFLKIKLRQGRHRRLNFQTAIKRSFSVWLRGLGMMIPLINGVCLFFAYYRLKTFQKTTWDQDDCITVSSSPIGKWRVGLSAFFTTVAFLFYFKVKHPG